MDHEQLTGLIREHGGLRMAQIATEGLGVQLKEGWNLTAWRVDTSRGGMMLFARHDGAAPLDPARAARDEQRAALRRTIRELRPASYHDPEVRTRRTAAQRQLDDLDREAKAEGEQSLPPATAGILCVNAPEDRRAEFAAQLNHPDDGDFPVTLLMREQWSTEAPF